VALQKLHAESPARQILPLSAHSISNSVPTMPKSRPKRMRLFCSENGPNRCHATLRCTLNDSLLLPAVWLVSPRDGACMYVTIGSNKYL
jgi:hypothetical protein